MAYLGNIAANRFASTPATKRFSGDGSTTSFTLDTAASADQEILVSVNGVIQDSANYTVTGTTLDFGSGNAPSAGTNNIFVNYIATPIATVGHPSTSNLQAAAGTFTSTLNVTGATTLSGAFTSPGIDDNASANAMTIDSNGVLQSVAGRSILPEFIDNCFLASNTASSVELQNCFSTTYSVYRLIGVVGGRFAGESNVRFTFLTGTNTAETEGMHGVLRHHDDASSSGYIPHANTSFATIVGDQSSTGFSVVDMHIYMQATAVQLIGMSGYHDQESDRGIGVFGYKSNQSTARTGFKITANVSGNLSAVNFSVYGIRIRQNATTKMDGSYS